MVLSKSYLTKGAAQPRQLELGLCIQLVLPSVVSEMPGKHRALVLALPLADLQQDLF
jgi:hypothetical protein